MGYSFGVHHQCLAVVLFAAKLQLMGYSFGVHHQCLAVVTALQVARLRPIMLPGMAL
jgi:hypothetical protein